MIGSFKMLVIAAIGPFVLSQCDLWMAPIATKPTAIDPRILGRYDGGEDINSHKHLTLIIEAKSPTEYRIKNFWSEGYETTAFLSQVADRRFFNMRWRERYVLGTFQLRGQLLVYWVVNSEVISNKLQTSDEIERAIKANIQNPNLWMRWPGSDDKHTLLAIPLLREGAAEPSNFDFAQRPW